MVRAEGIHLVAPYYMTHCGKNSINWNDRAYRTTNDIKRTTCVKCLLAVSSKATEQIYLIGPLQDTAHGGEPVGGRRGEGSEGS